MERNRRRLKVDRMGEPLFRPEQRVLLEDCDRSYRAAVRPGETGIFDNKLIFGENLIALRVIEDEHGGAITCVFIDPPYNTGSAFEHYDDGIDHSLWLSSLGERIAILHRLLAPGGSLWISIDDTESHYLKVLCDGIFGRENFVANVIWQKKYTVANDARWFSDNHDHILVYAKDKTNWRPNRLPRSEEMNARYANPDNDPKGPWKSTPLHAKSGSEKARRFEFSFSNGVRWSPPPGTFARFSEETLKRLDAENAIWFGRDGSAMPSRKTYLSELAGDGTPPLTVWLHGEVGHNHEAKNEVKAFNADEVFDTPKPERLLHRIIDIATKPGDIVLDAFAGSGTSGAVAHKLGRRWIMVERGEHCHTHIIPRLKKVIDGDDPGGITAAVKWKGGGGFTYYRLHRPMDAAQDG